MLFFSDNSNAEKGYIYRKKMRKYRWGILAPGKMAAKFTRGLQILGNAELYAVGSRDIKRAESFAGEFGFKKFYGSYEELVADPELEVVYVASPHSHHREHTLLCLRSGKHVICEKAFAINASEASEMISLARVKKLFLMEALWPPFQPFYRKATEILASGKMGNLIHLEAWFSFIPPYNADDRKFNLSLGGGSLLDIGIYPVIDALTFLGEPADIKASASFAPSGSEESVSVIFSYPGNRKASLYSSFRTNTGIGCRLLCENGNITVSRGRDMNQRVITEMHSGENEVFVYSPPAMGYHWEAEELMNCLEGGLTESSVVPLDFSLSLIRTLDRIRQEAGISFPGE
jgi:predicted dehydrogenase